VVDFFETADRRPRAQPPERWRAPGGAEVALFVGDLAEAPAEVLCTSTNSRFSLLGGTGAAIIESAGWGLRDEAQAIVEAARASTGRAELDVGTVHRTSAGRLPRAFVLHCVASGPGHRTSVEAIRSCVRGALGEADRAGRFTLAMPVFGAGHAGLPFARAVRAIAEELASTATTVPRIVLVVFEEDRVTLVRRILDEVLPRISAKG
jgi:O-acetyl-ADP-ribose deacetylase (regulator of RNase III)